MGVGDGGSMGDSKQKYLWAWQFCHPINIEIPAVRWPVEIGKGGERA